MLRISDKEDTDMVMEDKTDYLGIGYKSLQEVFAGSDGKGATNE